MPRRGADDPVGVEAMTVLEALDRVLRAWAEDPVGMQVQRALQHADRVAAIARVQRAARTRCGWQRQRDEQRDEKMSCRGPHRGTGGAQPATGRL